MIKIAIVEDEKKEQDLLSSFFNKLEKEKGFNVNIQVFSSGEAFLFEFEYNKFDVVLMDIDFGEGKMNGITASQKMRKVDADVILVFITNLAQFAIDGYNVQASDFIVKPFSYYDFSIKMSNIISNGLSRIKEKIILKSDGRQIIVSIKDICYIEVDNHTIIYHTKNGDYSTIGSLSLISKELEGNHFSLCNSCYLVNLRFVESISGPTVIVNHKELVVSRSKKKSFIEDLNEFMGL